MKSSLEALFFTLAMPRQRRAVRLFTASFIVVLIVHIAFETAYIVFQLAADRYFATFDTDFTARMLWQTLTILLPTIMLVGWLYYLRVYYRHTHIANQVRKALHNPEPEQIAVRVDQQVMPSYADFTQKKRLPAFRLINIDNLRLILSLDQLVMYAFFLGNRIPDLAFFGYILDIHPELDRFFDATLLSSALQFGWTFYFFLAFLVLGWPATTRFTIANDGLVVGRGLGRRRVFISWSAVRGIYRGTIASTTTKTSAYTKPTADTHGYILRTDSDFFAWTVAPRARRRVAANESLLAAIDIHAGLAACDITTLLEATIADKTAPMAVRPTFKGAWTLGSFSLLLVMSLVAATLILPNSWQGYLAHVPSQLQQKTPTFTDALTIAPDEHWQTFYDGDHATIGVTPQGYRIKGTASDAGALVMGPSIAGDSAITVTVTQHQPAPKGQENGIGLVVGLVSATGSYMLYQVQPTGRWELWSFNGLAPADSAWELQEYGADAAIHTGVGSSNVLLLVHHGIQWYLYINEHYISLYADTAGAIHDGDNVGLYLNGADLDGLFRDFKLYTLHPSQPWLLV